MGLRWSSDGRYHMVGTALVRRICESALTSGIPSTIAGEPITRSAGSLGYSFGEGNDFRSDRAENDTRDDLTDE